MPRNNPAAPVATGPIARLSVQVVLQSQIYECILDYMSVAPTPVNLSVLGGFLAAWRIANEANWQGILSAQAVIQTYIVAEVQVGMTPSLVVTGVNKTGSILQPPLPGTVAAVATKLSSLKGQHGRGRAYFMAIPTTFTSPATEPNTLNAAGLAAYLTLTSSLVLPVTGGGATWNLSVSTRPIAPITVVTNAIPVTTFTTQTILGNVRRRREGRGI